MSEPNIIEKIEGTTQSDELKEKLPFISLEQSTAETPIEVMSEKEVSETEQEPERIIAQWRDTGQLASILKDEYNEEDWELPDTPSKKPATKESLPTFSSISLAETDFGTDSDNGLSMFSDNIQRRFSDNMIAADYDEPLAEPLPYIPLPSEEAGIEAPKTPPFLVRHPRDLAKTLIVAGINTLEARIRGETLNPVWKEVARASMTAYADWLDKLLPEKWEQEVNTIMSEQVKLDPRTWVKPAIYGVIYQAPLLADLYIEQAVAKVIGAAIPTAMGHPAAAPTTSMALRLAAGWYAMATIEGGNFKKDAESALRRQDIPEKMVDKLSTEYARYYGGMGGALEYAGNSLQLWGLLRGRNMKKTATAILAKTPLWKMLLTPLGVGGGEAAEELGQGFTSRLVMRAMFKEAERRTGKQLAKPVDESLWQQTTKGGLVGTTMGMLGLPGGLLTRKTAQRQIAQKERDAGTSISPEINTEAVLAVDSMPEKAVFTKRLETAYNPAVKGYDAARYKQFVAALEKYEGHLESLTQADIETMASVAEIKVREPSKKVMKTGKVSKVQKATDKFMTTILKTLKDIKNVDIDTEHNKMVASDQARFGSLWKTFNKQNIDTANPDDLNAVGIYWQKLKRAYDKGMRFKMNVVDFIKTDIIDLGNKIETTTGEPGVYETFRHIEETRSMQRAENDKFQTLLQEHDSSLDDLAMMPEEQFDVFMKYKETGKGKENLDPHYLDILDNVITPWLEKKTGRYVKWNRVENYCVYGLNEKKDWTKAQHELLKPLLKVFRQSVKDGTIEDPANNYTQVRDEFLASDDSSILLRKNYLNRSFFKEGAKENDIDDAFIATMSMNKEYRDNRQPPHRSESALRIRRDDTPLESISDNPLIRLVNHIARQEIIYYFREPLATLHAKVVTGRYRDGRFANRRSIETGRPTPIVAKSMEKHFTEWYTNLLGMRKPAGVVERVMLIKPRANLWKAIAFGVWIKEAPQRFFGGVNDPRYVKATEFLPYNLVKKNIDTELPTLLPKDVKRASQSLEHTLGMGGAQIEREWGGVGTSVNLSRDDMGIWNYLALSYVHLMTDNAIINWVNKAPVIGGDFWMRRVKNADKNNRATNWIEQVRKGADLIIKQGLSYSQLVTPLRLNLLNDSEQHYLCKLLASGDKVGAVLYNAERQATIGNYRYDTKLSSFALQDPICRRVMQYHTWWRGFISLGARMSQRVIGNDWMSNDPMRQRINGVKSMLIMTSLYTVSQLILRGIRGRWVKKKDDETITRNVLRNIKYEASIDKYSSPSGGGPKTLATPGAQIYNFFKYKEYPAQVLASMHNIISIFVVGISDAVRAYGALAYAKATGDDKAYEKADKLRREMVNNITGKTFQNAKEYSIAARWAFSILDHTESLNQYGGTLGANWFRVGLEKTFESTGYWPDWYQEYRPDEYEYEAFEKIAQSIFLTKPTRKEIEEQEE